MGCTESPILSVLAMEVILRAAKGGANQQISTVDVIMLHAPSPRYTKYQSRASQEPRKIVLEGNDWDQRIRRSKVVVKKFLQNSSSRYSWRHIRVFQELSMATCGAKVLPVQPKARALVYKSEGGTKSLCGSATSMDTQRKSLLNDCDDWAFSADRPECNRHPKVIQDTGMRPDIIFHSSATRQIS
ncbi:reverse transcriptase [Plakobranchus ocellatus]|uniref:Reverse transcriptase n=1 Tax=Plakobranchus ocellatus TaxID=259542 RepID=A0AAV4C0J8_9GAST|nr:reverse transcriptase [Plakobranchus ocellatus]